MNNEIVKILCRRDNISIEEAEERVRYAIKLMGDAGWDPEAVEEIMMEELGLEADYIFDLI